MLVAVGGAVGAVARYLVAVAFARRLGTSWPWGTLFINLTGSFLVSVFVVRLTSDAARYLLPIGFVGGYTTFSTFELETLNLLRAGRVVPALLYVGASNLIGLLAAWLGLRASS